MDMVNWGVLGAAKFAREYMAPAIHAAKGARFYGLATTSEEKATPFKEFAPDLKVYADYDALLTDPNIDAVYIPLPNTLHVEWSKKAMQAGKHVLCEKPIAMKAEEIDELIALRDQTGLFCAEAYMILHHAQWKKAKALYDAGEIGELRHVAAFFSYDNSSDPGNIRNTAQMGGGGVPDIGVYTYGATRFVSGQEPMEIQAHITWENGVDVKSDVMAQFPGFTMQSMVSMRLCPYQEMIFHGTKGLMKLSAPFNPQVFGQAELELRRADGEVTRFRWPAEQHYVNQVEAFCKTVRDGADYAGSLEFARGSQAMIDMVFAAANGA